MYQQFFSVVILLVGAVVWADAPRKITPQDLDQMVKQEVKETKGGVVDDAIYLRRVSLDVIGRPPTPEEQSAFSRVTGPDKRAKLVERLLASPEFGQNWANYWSDTIASRVPPPELTFLNYKWFKSWLADEFNKNTPWDQIVRQILTAKGDITKSPAVTYIGFHQGRASKLAAETARVFLGLQLQCAECHDSKFDIWKREQFHGLAAFFARSTGKLNKNQDGSSTVVADAGKGEHVMPNVIDPKKPGKTMVPAFLTGEKLDLKAGDVQRRELLAKVLTKADNPWFAKAFTNRIWAQVVGRGFCEPVDDMNADAKWMLTKVHQTLSDHFVASGFDVKDLLRLILASETYQLDHMVGEMVADVSEGVHAKLSGDEIFRSLQQAIGLKNVTPPARKPTAAERFPPPPLSTAEMVACKFCYDPSLAPEAVSRTMGQAMLLMNNKEVQAAINADPRSGTLLSRVLSEESDNKKAIVRLFQQVLSRPPSDQEVTIALDHINEIGRRGEAFEDLVWSLINSAEFTTKR